MKKVTTIIGMLALVSVLFVALGLSWQKSQIRKIERYTESVTEQIISGLDDQALINQLFMFYFKLDDYDAVNRLAPGGIFIHTNNIPVLKNGEQDLAALDSLVEKINDIYRRQNLPRPFYSIDQEGGRVRRIKTGATDFPSTMTIAEAYGKSGRKDLPMLAAFYTCMELRSHGIQWPLTPVADVQSNPDNPVIGVRSFGSEPGLVSLMVEQYVMGLQNARCMTSVKHFPGHGDTSLDSHRDLPEIHKSVEEMNSVELYPYEKLISGKHAPWGIMSAHIIFRGISDRPATLSSEWLSGKLRKEWDYKGIIITDDLAMNAINIYQKNANTGNVAVEAFLAGADILLYVFKPAENIEMLAGFRKAVDDGRISRERILESARRIINRKIQLGIMDQYIRDNMPKWPREIAEKAEILLQRSAEIEKNIKSIESQLARPDSINEFISHNGIKTLYGNPDSVTNIQSLPLFTDIPVTDPDYNRILQKTKNVYPIGAISSGLCPEKCVVLQTATAPLENLFALKGKIPAIVFTVNEPFPRKKIAGSLSENDILVTTFSPTPTSRKKLIELYLENVLPPKAAVKF